MSLSVTVLGESHCFSDFPGPAGVPAENSSRVRSTATAGETTRQPVPEARWRIYNVHIYTYFFTLIYQVSV
jgi:hypothetical protein